MAFFIFVEFGLFVRGRLLNGQIRPGISLNGLIPKNSFVRRFDFLRLPSDVRVLSKAYLVLDNISKFQDML